VTKSFKLICDCLKWLSKEGFHFYWTLHIKVAAWHFRALKDCCLDALVVDEFFFSGSFLSFEAHHKTQGVSQGVAQAYFLLRKVMPFLWHIYTSIQLS
jgi:hypothetical protein